MDCTKQHLNSVIPAKNSKTTTTRPTKEETTIIYLPSFWNPCKNVPSRTTAATTTTTTTSYTKTFRANSANGISSCCCNRWEHENFYEKHAMTPSLTTTKIAQLPQQPLKYEKIRLSNINNINSKTNIICTSKKSRVSRLILLKHQRYNDLLSTMERAHTSTTTTNTITSKLISFKTETKYCNSSIPQNIELSQLNQQTSELTTSNDTRFFNYARICFTKNNYDSNSHSVYLKNNSPTQIDMPIDNENSNRLMVIAHQDESTKEEYNRFGNKDSLSIVNPLLSKTNLKNSQTTTTLSSRCFNNIVGSCSSTCNRENDECDEASKLLMNSITRPCRTFDICTYLMLILLELFRRKVQQNVCCQQMKFGSEMLKTFTTTKWLFCVMLLMLTTSANCWAGRQDVPTNCTFPARWEGSWFLSGYQQSIHIKGSQFSYRGKCAASDGNKYLIVDEKGCHRCLVIYEKHKNVLQYKESECEGDSIYMHQSNPSALAMRSVLKQSDHRGGAHPNINGHSRLSSSDQYIMRSNDDMNDYFCKGRETLQNLCDQIPGDALLYSLFRESAEPVKCPLKGPFVFTYNRGHGECKSPVSNIESCTEESRLLLSFQACPDVQGTESTVEELTCLATWKDGNSRYLVGLVSHHHAISNEERYRCFVYEKISSLMGGPSLPSAKDAEYKLAQSGDATCNGLDSAEVGSRIMSLRKPPLAERCDFPVWFKGPRHWHGLMGNSVYNYHSNDGSIHIIKPNGYMETRALCEQINKQTSTEMMAVVHYTTGCQSGFMCMMFLRRDTHVIEIQTGKQASRLEDACASDYFDIHKMPFITLLASNPDPQICPMEGLYNLRGAIGPPYMTTRHKRNHNNKIHAGHGHHHQLNEEVNSNGHAGLTQKSFRNGDKTLERSAWHASTRGLPVRSRRNTPVSDDQYHVSVGATELMLKDDQANQTAMELMLRNRRNVPGCITNFKAQRQLWVGCTEPNVIDVRPLCNDEGDEEYSCHGSWSENGTVHIIARHKSTKHGVCISYRPTEGNSAKLYVGDTCYRSFQKGPDHLLEANLSVFGKCGETRSRSNVKYISSCLVISAVAILTTLIGKLQVNLEAGVHR